MALSIYTLGSFEVHRDGHVVSDIMWKTQKNKHLCKILLTHAGHALPKERLMEWLWSDLEPDAAVRNLRVAVSQLRKALEPDLPKGAKSSYVLTTDAGYAWNTTQDVWLDADEFEKLCARFDLDAGLEDHQLEYAKRAKALYRGPYLEEDRYEDWATARREQLQLAYFDLLAKLAEAHARLGRYQQALAHCREILRADPCCESVWAQLMLYLHCSGNQAEALRAYGQCARILSRELDVEPNLQLQQLHDHIRNGQVPDVDDRYPIRAQVVPPVPYTLSPQAVPFVGRQAERARFARLFEQLHQGQGGCLIVGGEPGVGKTRLVQEVLLDADEFVCLSAYAHDLDQTLAYQCWRHTLDQAIELVDINVFESIEPVWLCEVARLVPSLHARFELPQNPELAPDQQLRRFHQGIFQVLSVLSQGKPLVIFLDDVHWLDEVSFDLWAYLLPRLAAFPVCVIGTFQQSHENENLSKFLAQNDAHLETLSLPRLSSQESISLVQNLPLNLENLDAFCGTLYKQTEGNPLFIISTLQHLFESGVLAADGNDWKAANEAKVPALDTAPTIQALILKRLERLDDAALKLLRLISVMDRKVDVPLLELAWDEEDDCALTLSSLISAQLLSETMGQYALSHAKIGEVVRRHMSDPLRQLLNQRALYAVEQRHIGRLGAWQGALMHYAFRGGVWEKALTYAVRLVGQGNLIPLQEKLAAAALGVEAAQRLAASSKDTRFVQDQLFEILVHRADLFGLQGKRDDQARDLAQLAELAQGLKSDSRRALVQSKFVQFYLAKGEFDAAIKAAQKAIALYKVEQDVAGQANCLNHMGQALHQQGDPTAGLDAMQQALSLFEQCKHLKGQADCLKNIGQIHFFSLANYTEALACFEQANAHYATVGDPLGQASCCNSIGNVCVWCLNRPEEAVQRYQQALEIARDVGDRLGQGMMLNNIGNAYRRLHLGKHHLALDYLQQAHDIGQEVGDPIGRSIGLSNIGKVYASIGRYNEAMSYHRRALEINRAIGERDEAAGNLYELGKISLTLKDANAALNCLKESLAISTETEDERALIYCNVEIGRAYGELGQFETAMSHYAQADNVSKALDIPAERLNLLLGRAATQLQQGHLEGALKDTKAALDLLQPEQDEETPEVYYLYYRVLMALGRAKEAAPYLQRAHDTLMTIADLMQAPEDRDSYLNAVSHNAEIVAAWARHLGVE